MNAQIAGILAGSKVELHACIASGGEDIPALSTIACTHTINDPARIDKDPACSQQLKGCYLVRSRLRGYRGEIRTLSKC